MNTREIADTVKRIAVGGTVFVSGDVVTVTYSPNALRRSDKANWQHTYSVAKAIRAALPEATVKVTKLTRSVHHFGGCSGRETRDTFHVLPR